VLNLYPYKIMIPSSELNTTPSAPTNKVSQASYLATHVIEKIM